MPQCLTRKISLRVDQLATGYAQACSLDVNFICSNWHDIDQVQAKHASLQENMLNLTAARFSSTSLLFVGYVRC